MKKTILFTVLLPVLVGCDIDRNELPDTPSGYTSNSTYYSILIKDINQTPLTASALPDDFRLSDPDTRIFDSDTNGCIRVPKNYAFDNLKILCCGYLPVYIQIDQFTDQNQIEITLIEDPNE